MYVEFIETSHFKKTWEKAGLTDDDLKLLQELIIKKPDGDGGIKNSGKLKKVRYARPGRGKSGDSRIIYCYFISLETVILLHTLEKKDSANISTQVARQLDSYAEQIEAEIKLRKKKHEK